MSHFEIEVRVSLSAPQDSPWGKCLGRLYYETEVIRLLGDMKLSGFPHNGGEHSLIVGGKKKDVIAWIDIVIEFLNKSRYREREEAIKRLSYEREVLMWKHTRKVSGILTKEEARIYSESRTTPHVITHCGTIGGESYFFFSTEHCCIFEHAEKFVPCTTYFPHAVKERPVLPSGIVRNVDDYLKIYHQNETLIESKEELKAIFNAACEQGVEQ